MEGVKTIGGYAFRDCAKLTAVAIGEAIETIGDYAFYGCEAFDLAANMPAPVPRQAD